MAVTQERKQTPLLISREFNAPRETVWKHWTEPESIMQWWGPRHFSACGAKIDLSIGGKYLFCMRSPEGKDYWSGGRFQEIVEPERIVATDSFADENGNVVPASHYGMGTDFPLEMVLAASFEDAGGRTRLTLEHAGMPESARKDAEQGWNETLDKFARLVEMR